VNEIAAVSYPLNVMTLPTLRQPGSTNLNRCILRSLLRLFCLAIGAAFLFVGSTSHSAMACPYCRPPDLSLTEQVEASDSAVLVQWVEGEEADRDKSFAGTTTYEIIDILKDDTKTLSKEKQITIERYRASKPGNLFLMLGSKATIIEWGSPIEITETGYNYVKQAPSTEHSVSERLNYFVKFLEFKDPLISTDAIGEFAKAKYEEVADVAENMPAEKLRGWLSDTETDKTLIGLYGMMLGHAGTKEDAQFLQNIITAPGNPRLLRLGMDGVMHGYLMLAGTEGLDFLDDYYKDAQKLPISEFLNLMQALRNVWTYEKETVGAERLRQSMRQFVDNPSTVDLVIPDLARWEDWSILEHLTELYGEGEYARPVVKRAMLRFMLAAVDSVPKDQETKPEYVKKARAFLDKIEEAEPELYKSTLRTYFR